MREKAVHLRQVDSDRVRAEETCANVEAALAHTRAALEKKSEGLEKAWKERVELERALEVWKARVSRLESMVKRLSAAERADADDNTVQHRKQSRQPLAGACTRAR